MGAAAGRMATRGRRRGRRARAEGSLGGPSCLRQQRIRRRDDPGAWARRGGGSRARHRAWPWWHPRQRRQLGWARDGRRAAARRGAALGSFDPSESPYMAAGLRMDSRRTITGWILWIEMQKCRQILIDERKDSGRIFFYFVGLKCILSSSQCPTWHVSDQMD